jgi:hypothetical protein
VSTSLVILGCSQRKAHTSRLLPAIDRYDGPAFRVLRKYNREETGNSVEACVLSARFGLVPGNLPLPLYDCELPQIDRTALRTQVEQQFKRTMDEVQPQRLFVSLGCQYLPLIAEPLTREVAPASLVIATGGIGGRASRLVRWLKSGEDDDRMIKPVPPRGEAALLGTTVRLSREEVLQATRNALSSSPAAACRFETWYVPVDEHRVAPKWLVSVLFDKPVSRFRTADARRVLLQLGVETKYAD